MIRLIQRRLIIPRGDTGSFTIPVQATATGNEDVSVFTIFDASLHKKVFEKIVQPSDGVLNVEFTHADTVNLPVGEYVWDIKFYKNAVIVDGVFINGDEVNSYYAAFKLPVCEIRETGDTLLMGDDAPNTKISPESLNVIAALATSAQDNKNASDIAAETAAAAKDIAVSKADEASAAATTATAALEEIQGIVYTIPTKVSDLPNDANYAVDANYVHTDNNYTTAEKTKLSGIAAGAEVNVNADWNAVSGDAQILNKPTNVSAFENDSGYLTEHQDLSDYVKNTDYATSEIAGVVKINDSSTGIAITPNGTLRTNPAILDQIKAGASGFQPLQPGSQHASTFYGLAKAARDTTQSQSSNAVGVYTDEAKAAIQQMLDVPSTSDIPEVPVQDVQVNSTSILDANGVANVPVAYANDETELSTLGVVKIAARGIEGLRFRANYPGHLMIAAAGNNGIKQGVDQYKPIVPVNQHVSAFYGLAKAAGDTTQSQSANAVGTYTAEAKSAIQTMLDVPSNATVASQISTAIGNINSFDLSVVQSLPSQDISTHTIYLVPKTGDTNDVYDEYVYINNAWEMVGNTQIDLSNYITFSDIATRDNAGVAKYKNEYGLYITNDGYAAIYYAPQNAVKRGTEGYRPIVPANQHQSIFYGLAKAAGDSTQSGSSNAVGTYTDEAKAAIQQMLDVPSNSDIPEVPVQDVQVNGVSVLDAQGVANVPLATQSAIGVVKVGDGLAIQGTTGRIFVDYANNSAIKAGTNNYRAITPGYQEKSTFYGLAKAAGADMKNIANTTIGTYPDAQKEAIQSMLGISQMLAPTNTNLVASQAYSIGDVFAANGHLYKATAAIAQDGTIIPDTNCVETTMAEAGGKIKDVQVAGSSVVGSDGVASIPLATSNDGIGVVRASPAFGTQIGTNALLFISSATSNYIKAGTHDYRPIVPKMQHESIFYGLSKAAGVDLANETVTLGTYPETSKTAIKTMLGVQDGLKVVRLI